MNLNSRVISDSLEVVVALSNLGQFGVRRLAGLLRQFLGKCYPHIHGEKSRAAIGWGVGVLGVPLARCPLFRASVDVLGIFP